MATTATALDVERLAVVLNVEEIPGGPELDLLAAHRVMGLTVGQWGDLLVVADSPEKLASGYAVPLAAYSTDIAAAFLVHARLVELGYVLRIESDKEGDTVEVWTDKGTPSHYRPLADEDGPIPLAICRAALKATQENT